MNNYEMLRESETEGTPYSPQQSFFVGIDIYVSEVTCQWLSPGDIWVDLQTFNDVGRYWVICSPGDTLRFVTSSPGTRCWGRW